MTRVVLFLVVLATGSVAPASAQSPELETVLPLIERLCLWNRPRVSVEQETGGRIRLLQPVAHQPRHHAVVDETPTLDNLLDLESQWCARLDRCPQHCAG